MCFFKWTLSKNSLKLLQCFVAYRNLWGGGIGGSLGRITTEANFPYDKQGVLKRVWGISECVWNLYTIVFKWLNWVWGVVAYRIDIHNSDGYQEYYHRLCDTYWKLSDGPYFLQKQIKLPPTKRKNTVWWTFVPIVQKLKTKKKTKGSWTGW